MAPDKTVDIGNFSIASKLDKEFALNVSISMSLSLPEHLEENLTANDLRDQVKAGALWLTRASSCRLMLAMDFEQPTETSVHGDAHMRQIAVDAFQSHPIWHDLGLELHLELNVLQSNRTPSTNSVYNIQHTQQRSGLFVPQNVPCGYLSELSCSLRYAARSSRAPENTEESVSRPRNRTHYNLRNLVRAPSEPLSVNTTAFWGLPPHAQAERVVHLTHNALHLMLGTRQRCLGDLCLDGTKPPALLELAPAVWNAQYFQNAVTRAQLIPAITSALGNLMSTQSPVLRRKIESLVPEPAAGPGLDRVLDELNRRTQLLLLRSTRDQRTKFCLQKIKVQSAHPPAPGLGRSLESSYVSEASTSNDFTNYAILNLRRETLNGQVDGQSHESMPDLPDEGSMYLESGHDYGFTAYGTSTAKSDGIDLAPEEDYRDSDMEGAEWIEDDVVSDTSESLLEYGDQYDEDYLGDEFLGLNHMEQEYQEQRLVPDDAHRGHDMETADFYDESDCYGYYYEISDTEAGVQPTVHASEGYPAESHRATGTLEKPGDDASSFITDEDAAMGDDIYQHLGDDEPDFDEGQNDPRETNDGYIQEDMLHGADVDNEMGPDYVTAGHVHHNDHVETAENNMRVGWHDQLLQDSSQLPRNSAYHGNETLWAHPGRHSTTTSRRLASYGQLGRSACEHGISWRR